MNRRFGFLLGLLAFVACKGDSAKDSSSGGEAARKAAVADGGRCPIPEEDPRHLESSVYDTSGDAIPDVRKVFLVVEDGRERRTIMVCREADLNGDGLKDIVRFYDDEGNPVREESDRNFDGKIDSITVFDGGRILLKELDEDFDGRIETKIFYDGGRPMRVERDTAGRRPGQFSTDRWEYIEDGRVVRIGMDLDGDGKVDRWERDVEVEQERQRRERERLRREEEARRRENAAQAEEEDD